MAEYTEKHYDAAISSQLRQLEEDTAIHGDILNFRDKVAALSFTLGVDVHHENSPSKIFIPDKFYEKIQQLLTADEKHQKGLSPETRAFYNALEAIFEEEIPGAEIFKNSATDKSRRADKKFRMAIDKLTHENASRELPFADDILKFARNIRLVKQGRGRSTEATINTRKDKSSSVFKHLDDYIWCEHLKGTGNTSDIRKAVKHARQCLKDGAPFKEYLSSITYYQLWAQLPGNVFAPF